MRKNRSIRSFNIDILKISEVKTEWNPAVNAVLNLTGGTEVS
jgi:hypothetical protein